MTEEETRIERDAIAFVKSHRKEIIEKFAHPDACRPVNKPVSLFMAGSPGAGKTEVSKGFMRRFKDMPIRIDADDIRMLCDGYTGANAHLFQSAANKGVNILYDYALEKNLNCILDGTFAYGNAPENISRSLSRSRLVEIWFVFQDPVKAWEFTKVREVTESRHVSRDVFIRSFKGARENVVAVKEQFGKAVELNVLIKDYEDGTEDVHLNVSSVELDRLTRGRYSVEELDTVLI
ncbi:MAG: zeta toxin family protein [bacterium]